MKECRDCGREFKPMPGKPGYIDQCPNCSKPELDVYGGNMVWHHKTAPELEIKPLAAAKRFSKLQARSGSGPLRSITTARENYQ